MKNFKNLLLVSLMFTILLTGCSNKKKDDTKIGHFKQVESTEKLSGKTWRLHSRSKSKEMVEDFNDLKWIKQSNNKKSRCYELNFKKNNAYIDVVSSHNQIIYGRKFKVTKGDNSVFKFEQEKLYKNNILLSRNKNIDITKLKKMPKKELVHPSKKLKYYVVKGKDKSVTKNYKLYINKNILILVEKKGKIVTYTRYVR